MTEIEQMLRVCHCKFRNTHATCCFKCFCVRAGVRGEQTRGVGVGGSAGRARRLGDARGGCELSRKWRGAGEEAGLKGGGVRQPVSSYFASE